MNMFVLLTDIIACPRARYLGSIVLTDDAGVQKLQARGRMYTLYPINVEYIYDVQLLCIVRI